MISKLIAPVLTVLACAAIWYAFNNLSVLRGSVLWDLRYVVLGVAAVLCLSAAEWIVKRFDRR